MRWEFIIRNAAAAFTPPKTKKVGMHIWDNEQVKVFLEAAKGSPYHQII